MKKIFTEVDVEFIYPVDDILTTSSEKVSGDSDAEVDPRDF